MLLRAVKRHETRQRTANDAILPFMKRHYHRKTCFLLCLTVFSLIQHTALHAAKAPLGLSALLPGGARSSALAGCSALLTESTEDFHANPALIAGIPRTETGFGIDIRTDGLTTPAFWLGLPVAQDSLWLGLSFRQLAPHARSFAPTISPHLSLPPDLDYQASATLGLAWRISGPLSMGAALLAHVSDGTNSTASTSPGLALGCMLSRTPSLPLSLAIAFLNIVPTLEPGRVSASLPWIWRASAAWRCIESWPHSLDLGFEWSGGEDRPGRIAAALEYSIESRWFFRTGLAAGDTVPRLGLGFRDISPDISLAVDLSWQHADDNSNVFRVSIAFGF